MNLTQALIERLKTDQTQHLEWCSMAKNVLEQAPVQVNLDETMFASKKQTKTALRSPMLFSVLLSLGLVGAVSWSALQAKPTSVQVQVPTKQKLAATALDENLQAADRFKMSYQLGNDKHDSASTKDAQM